jgi:hypothetical protein
MTAFEVTEAALHNWWYEGNIGRKVTLAQKLCNSQVFQCFALLFDVWGFAQSSLGLPCKITTLPSVQYDSL